MVANLAIFHGTSAETLTDDAWIHATVVSTKTATLNLQVCATSKEKARPSRPISRSTLKLNIEILIPSTTGTLKNPGFGRVRVKQRCINVEAGSLVWCRSGGGYGGRSTCKWRRTVGDRHGVLLVSKIASHQEREWTSTETVTLPLRAGTALIAL